MVVSVLEGRNSERRPDQGGRSPNRLLAKYETTHNLLASKKHLLNDEEICGKFLALCRGAAGRRNGGADAGRTRGGETASSKPL
jgi:hypothetical protein